MKIKFTMKLGLLIALSVLAGSMFVGGCKDEAPSLYDPTSLPQPLVDSVSPAGSALAGIDTVTVYGSNFSADKTNDGVFFNSTLVNNASIISASATKLVLKAPAISGDTVKVRVYVIGATDFSPTYNYKLIAAVAPFSKFADAEGAYGICIGSDLNLYASLSNSNLGTKDEGIYMIAGDGTIAASPYALPTTGNVYWSAIQFGQGGFVYALKGNRAIYRLAQGGVGTSPWAVLPGGTTLSALDIAPNNYIWVGGNNSNLYRVKTSDATNTAFPFTGNVRSIRYYDGYLYFAANVTAGTQVLRAPITSDALGTPEVYFDASSVYASPVPTIWAITFSEDGDMYVGMDGPDYLMIVHPNGTVDMPYSLYVGTGVLKSPVKAFAWSGTTLYAATDAGGLLKIAPRKSGAPYIGIQ